MHSMVSTLLVHVHLSVLILSLVAHLHYPKTETETLAPPFLTYGNSPASPAHLSMILYFVSRGLLCTSV